MNKPRLPSQLHPDYPKMRIEKKLHGESGFDVYYPVPFDVLKSWFDAHPEFAKEGEYKLICPFCGDENGFDDQGGYCCGEVGHCEWIYFDINDEEADAP